MLIYIAWKIFWWAVNCNRIFEQHLAPKSEFKPLLRLASYKEQRNLITGFTLVEIVLAVAILGSVLCAILAIYASCFTLATTSKNVNISTNAALSLIEEIRSSPFDNIMDDYNGLNFIVNDILLSRGVIFVDDTNADLLEVTVAVCWRQGNRVIGEDANLNGTLDAGEDINGNGIIDSPVKFVTRVVNR